MTLQKSSSVNPKQLAILKKALKESVTVKEAMLESPDMLEGVVLAAHRIAEALRRGGKVIFFGNGGSASDSLHMAGELVGRFGSRPRSGLPALALPANTAAVTAIANDFGYEEIFSRQVEAFGRSGDVVVGISTSGRSPNVLKGVAQAKKQGLFTIGFTGEKGGELAERVDLCLNVPSSNTQRIQEAHLTIGHALCELIEGELLET